MADQYFMAFKQKLVVYSTNSFFDFVSERNTTHDNLSSLSESINLWMYLLDLWNKLLKNK